MATVMLAETLVILKYSTRHIPEKQGHTRYDNIKIDLKGEGRGQVDFIWLRIRTGGGIL
jgi:hypothetical protein